jgi:predicted ATP-grasp superfamily ATP-dependent carboligase
MSIDTATDTLHADRAVLSFTGWPDAGEMIRNCVDELLRMLPWRPAATWDLDGFWHSAALRPEVRIEHGQIRRLEWPVYRFFVTSATPSPLLLGIGPEPTCNWRRFAATLLDQLNRWQCREVVLLGSLYDQVFHDEVVISAVVQNPKAFNGVHALGCRLVQYEGPGAIHAAIMEASPGLGIPCTSLWAHLPFYLKGPSEFLMSHYFQVLGEMLGIALETDHLAAAWEERVQQIERMMKQDDEFRKLLEQLKGADGRGRAARRPDSKVVRLDDFLRKRNDDDPAP